MKLDDLHYTTRKIDGYNKPFNFIISAREAGKSTYITLKKVYEQFEKIEFNPDGDLFNNIVMSSHQAKLHLHL